MSAERRIAAVVLTFNSALDLPNCLASLLSQEGVDLRIFVVDNCSEETQRASITAHLLRRVPNTALMEADSVQAKDVPCVYIQNNRNAGYSAGNNIGARLAVASGCEAILIINPDVRIPDPLYVRTLSDTLFAAPDIAAAGSAIENLAGLNENPMREPGFLEEMLWPASMLVARLSRGSTQRSFVCPERPTRVAKLSGACLLVKSSFLEAIGYFDEQVFLYCEESILSAQVLRSNLCMIYNPLVKALHHHEPDTKGDPLKRFSIWSQSRGYFHATYSKYGSFLRALLAGSRKITILLVLCRNVAAGRR